MKKAMRNILQFVIYFGVGYLSGMVVTHFLILPNLY